MNLRIGFSGVLSSCSLLSTTKPWNKYDFFFQYLRPISSNEGSLNQGRTSVKTGQDSPHISIQGTCTVTGLEFVSPLTPAKGNRIIARSIQKKVLFGSASGRNLTVAVCPSAIFQWAKIALSPPPLPEFC